MKSWNGHVIIAGCNLIPVGEVIGIDFSRLEREQVVRVRTRSGDFESTGFHAIEAMMLLKPSALEGKRYRWQKNAWAFHNMIGHPVLQLLVWLGFKRMGIRFHDYTAPCPTGFKERI